MGDINSWESHCLTCNHWDGDKALQLKEIEERGDIVMDKFKGWPTEGFCKISYEWSEVEINGDATAVLCIYANFGCVYHSERKH